MYEVSIILPVFNRPGLITRAIASVLGQSHSHWELIIVDDGSDDATPEILEGYRKNDRRIQILTQQNKGVAAARNAGVRHARYPWIAFLDSDDYWETDKLRLQLDFLDKNSGCLIVQTREKWLRHGKRVNPHLKHQMQPGNIFKASLELCLISPSAVLMSKKLFEELGGFDVSFPACEDYELWLRLTARHPVALIEQPLTVHTGGHADQLSRQYWGMDRFRIRAIEKLLRSGILNPEQGVQAFKTYSQKSQILAQGALKRGRLFYFMYLRWKQFKIRRYARPA